MVPVLGCEGFVVFKCVGKGAVLCAGPEFGAQNLGPSTGWEFDAVDIPPILSNRSFGS
jgi:hypothetical protein